MTNPRLPWVRAGRPLWVGIVLVVLLLLGVVSAVSSRSVERAETSARQRAERTAADVLGSELSPRLASDQIGGTDRRELLEAVQARILDDDRVARVRIWRPDGTAIFSAPRDAASASVPEDRLQFSQAAAGVPASVLVEASGAVGPLLRTYVPLRGPGGSAPYAVAQIDQRYEAIEADANRIWRLMQIVLVITLGVAAGLFAVSFAGGRAAQPAGEPRPVPGDGVVRDAEVPARGAEEPARTEGPARSADERRLSDAEERARVAEVTARRSEQRLADTERRLKEATRTLIPPDVLARIAELETNLDAEGAERHRSAGEVQRLRSQLEANEAELALAKERAGSTDAETARSAELVAKADGRAADAEGRAREAEQRATEAAGRLAASEARISELGSAVHQAEERATRAESEAERATQDRKSRSTKELRAAKREANAAKKKLAELEASLAEAWTKLAERERAVPEGGASVLEVELVRAERDVAKADLLRARQQLETTQAELEAARASIAALEPQRPDEIA